MQWNWNNNTQPFLSFQSAEEGKPLIGQPGEYEFDTEVTIMSRDRVRKAYRSRLNNTHLELQEIP
ncbi:MAG: hypothetical protein C4294_03785 [Nitrospiraceae bacterium]